MSDFLSITYPIARKSHQCDFCGRTIKVCDSYERKEWSDGTIQSWKTCRQCQDLLGRYPLEDDTGDGIDSYDFYDHVAELCMEHGIDCLNMDTEEMVDALMEASNAR